MSGRRERTSFYDAPVSGGSLGAANDALTFMLGCAADDPNFQLIEGLLSMTGCSIFPCFTFDFG